jgi:hypothetical protein
VLDFELPGCLLGRFERKRQMVRQGPQDSLRQSLPYLRTRSLPPRLYHWCSSPGSIPCVNRSSD